MGHKKLMKFLSDIGSKVGEHKFVNGQSQQGFGNLSPEGAKAKISMLMSDKSWSSKYLSGDKQAQQDFQTLHKMAYPS